MLSGKPKLSMKASTFWQYQTIVTLFLLGCLLNASITVAGANPVHAEFFTDSRHYQMNDNSREASATEYDLAAPLLLEKSFSIGLPANPIAAKKMADEWFMANQAQIRTRLQAAYEGHNKALAYGLTQYPAWVFDGKAVVYGVTDLREALGRYQDWQETSGKPDHSNTKLYTPVTGTSP